MTGEDQYLESSLALDAMAVEGATSMRDTATDAVGRDRIVERYAEIRARGGNY